LQSTFQTLQPMVGDHYYLVLRAFKQEHISTIILVYLILPFI